MVDPFPPPQVILSFLDSIEAPLGPISVRVRGPIEVIGLPVLL